MRIDNEHKPEQEDEFYQLDIIHPVELITEVGPVPPRLPHWPNHGNAHENVPCWAPAHGLGDRPECSVPDSGATIMLLGVVLVALSIWKGKCTG